MATDLERLVVQLSADTKQYQNALNRAMGITNRQTRQIESRFQRMNRGIANGFVGLGRSLAGGLAAGVAAREFVRLSDSATRIDNALKIAGLSGAELEKVYGRLRDSAVKNAAPLEALVELYSRGALVQADLGKSSEELVVFADKVALALRVGGRSAQESSGALLQLSQALGEGIVRAQEFNSMIEGAPALLQAAAAGIKEAGGSVARLRKIMLDGELSSRALFDGVIAGSSVLEERVKNAEYTIGQSMGNLRTALVDAAREFNNTTGVAGEFATGINNVAKAVSDFDVSGFIRKIQEAGGVLDKFLEDIANSSIMERFAEAITGEELTLGAPIDLETVEAEKDIANLERQIQILKDRIEANKTMAIDTTEAEAQLDALIQKAAAARVAVSGAGSMSGQNYRPGTPGDPNALAQPTLGVKVANPISIADPQYRVTDSSDGGKGSGRKGAKERADEYERLAARITDSTAALVAETEAMRGLDPLIDDYGYALEKARAEHELLTAAQEAGKTVTPELRAEIAALADQYALATVEAGKLAESQDLVRERAEEMRDFQKDLTRGIVDGFIQGKKAADIFADALTKVGNKLLDMAFNAAFDSGPGGGGGFLSNLFGGMFREKGGPVKKGQPYIVGEKRPEVFVPNQSGTIMPRVPSAPSLPKVGGAGGNAAPSVTYAPQIDARGASVEAVARLEQVIAKDKAEFSSRVLATVSKGQKGRHKF